MSVIPSQPSDSFVYQAQTPGGKSVSGTILSQTPQEADDLLRSLGLKVLQLSPIQLRQRPGALRGEDFITFNQQLAQLAEAGLPVEHGLRLIAREMGSGRMRATVNRIAEELESGTPLAQAFEKHRGQFPPLYGRLIDAGVRANNLPAMLLNFGRHAQIVQRMRAMIWEALAYPAMVLAALVVVIVFLGMYVLPTFEGIFKGFGTRLPAITELVLNMARAMPTILMGLAGLLAAILAATAAIRMARLQGWAVDHFVLPMPMIGPVMRRNLIARWCDAMSVAVGAGLDLPAAIDLAGEAVGSPKLRRDGKKLIALLESGRSPEGATDLAILPPTAAAILAMGQSGRDLPGALETLGQMYQQQAELRLSTIPAVLTPLLLLAIGLVIGVVILAMFAPMISLIQTVSGPHK